MQDSSRYRDFSAKELFELFFDNEIFELIVDQSVIYGSFCNQSITLEKKEVKLFIVVLIVSGYNIPKSRRQRFTKADDLRNVAVYNAIRRDKFEKIMRYIHFANNNTDSDQTDKYWKMRPLLKLMKENCMRNFVPCQSLSFDELMIEYYGRHSCKQAIRNKPIRLGYKAWTLTTNQGYLINFDLYQGKKTSSISDQKYEHIGSAPGALLCLIDEFPESVAELPFHFYFDNLFTTVNLMVELHKRGYEATGTVRQNYFPKENEFSSNTVMKKKQRGHFESKVYTVEEIDTLLKLYSIANSKITVTFMWHQQFIISNQ